MEKIILQVEGMSCAHCEKAVVNALTDMGAHSVSALAKDNTVEITYNPSVLSLDAIKDELDDMGYAVNM